MHNISIEKMITTVIQMLLVLQSLQLLLIWKATYVRKLRPNPTKYKTIWYTNMLEKYRTIFFLRNPGGFQLPRLHEATHVWIFSHLSIAPVDGKQHLSEVVFSALVGFSLYTTSIHHRAEQSPKSTTRMFSITYVMLYGAETGVVVNRQSAPP